MNKKMKLFLLTGLASLSLGLPVSAAPSGTTTASVTVQGGSLGLNSPRAELNLGNLKIDGTVQTLTGDLGTMPVSDLTGTGGGWNVTIAASTFSDGVHTLPQGSLALKGISSVTPDGTTSDAPVIVNGSSSVLIDSGAQKVLTATSGKGMGKYNVNFISNALALTVNTSTLNASASPYTSTVTYSIVTGP